MKAFLVTAQAWPNPFAGGMQDNGTSIQADNLKSLLDLA
jgi:hypothetical protein